MGERSSDFRNTLMMSKNIRFDFQAPINNTPTS